MSMTLTERHKLAVVGWVATIATSLCLLPTLDEKRFITLGALAGALLVGIGMSMRALRLPTLATLALQLVVLVEIIALGYGRHAKYGLLPTDKTWDTIGRHIDSGIAIAQTFAAPAPESVGLSMMLVFFIALTAMLVDFFAVGLGRVPLAGLPLLAMYTVPVVVLPDGVPAVAFIPGAVAFIALLMVAERERLAHWGRLVARGSSQEQAEEIDTSGLTMTGRRISLLSLALAVVLPIFIPTLSAGILSGSGNGSGPGNGGGLSFGDPMVSLANSLKRPDPQDVLTIKSDVSPSYLRMVVLDQPGPNAWAARPIALDETSPVAEAIPEPTGLSPQVATRAHSMTITPTRDFPQDSPWLPVPFDLQSLNVPQDWAYVSADQTVTATNSTAMSNVDSYQLSYNVIDPTAAQLNAAGAPPAEIQQRYGVVPSGVPSTVGRTAQFVTAGVNSNYQRALLLQSYFRDHAEFRYNVNVGYGYGYEAMERFLAQREGFCQQFAATMAMMARTLGIPSRVVVGFLQPRGTNSRGEYIMTSHNLHAWPELYFEGVGWVQFEPTPGVGAPFPSYAPVTQPPEGATTGPTQPTASTNPNTVDPTAHLPSEPAAGSGGSGNGSSGGPMPSRWWLVAVALLALAVTPAVLRAGVRRARMSRPVEAKAAAESAWTELRDHIRDLRLTWTGSMSPRARQQSVAGLLDGDPSGLAALGRLTISVERARYASSPLAGGNPAHDAREVMAVISRRADWPQRIRARVWPSSLIPDIRAGWSGLKQRLRP